MDLNNKKCELCKYHIFDGKAINTNPYNLCEGRWCDEAEEYLEEYILDEKIRKRNENIDFIIKN